MIENVITVGGQVIVLFILMAVGFLCNKIHMLKGKTIKDITEFMLYIVTPCVIINSYERDFDPVMMKGLLITFTAAVLSFAVNIVIAHLTVRNKDKGVERVLRFGAVFSNCGYMSLPLQNALLGNDGVFFGATYIAVFNIVLWTYGVIIMSGSIKNVSAKKIILSPGIIGTVIGFVVFFTSIHLPVVIKDPISNLAALNTPVAMVIVGYHLYGTSLKLHGISTYIAIIFRLIVSPLIVVLGFYILNIHDTTLIACTIAASAPCAAVTTMFAEKFDADVSLSSALVSVTTLLSVITMPIIVSIATLIK